MVDRVDHVDRAAPNSHHGDPDLLVGSVDLTYELLTDLVMPCDWKPEGAQPHRITLPGSGIRGAVRALHEVIAADALAEAIDGYCEQGAANPANPPIAEASVNAEE